MRTIWAGLLLFALCLGSRAAYAEVVQIPPAELLSHGIHPSAFAIVTFSPDNRSILGYEQAPTEDVAKGTTYRLYLLHLRSDGRVSEVRGYPVGIPSLEQAAFTPDGKGVVLITASGATYAVLDLETGKVRKLMEHRPEVPGFRADPPVLWLAGGKLLGLGYFYDKADYAGVNVIAEIDPSKTGVEAFTEGPKVEPVERALKGLAFHTYTTESIGFFGVKEKGLERFYRWVAGSKPVAFDEAVAFTGFAAAGDRVTYAAQRSGALTEMMIYDGATGAKQVVGTSSVPLKYVAMSQDGSTIVANQIDGARMKIFSASSRSGMKWLPVPDLPKGRVGTIRLTPDGRRMLLLNEDGLYLVDLP